MRSLLMIGLAGFGLLGGIWASEQPESLPVYAMHDIELGEGVNAKDFESFVAGEFAKAFREDVGGVRMTVLKGDRGERKGKYVLLMHFASKELRDKYYPKEGEGGSESFNEAIAPVNDVLEKLWTHLRHVGYTDFAALN